MKPTEQGLIPPEAWAEMALHMTWSGGLSVCFLFSDSHEALTQLRQLAEDSFHLRTAPIHIVAPVAADLAAQAVLQEMEKHQHRMGQVRAPVWVEVLAPDTSGETVWDAARATVLARLNEARTWLMNDFARPLIMCLPRNWQHRVVEVAPDLWHIRAFATGLSEQLQSLMKDVELRISTTTLPPEKNISYTIDYSCCATNHSNYAAVDPYSNLDASVEKLNNHGEVCFKEGDMANAVQFYAKCCDIITNNEIYFSGKRFLVSKVCSNLCKVWEIAVKEGNKEIYLLAVRCSLALAQKILAAPATNENMRFLALMRNSIGSAERSAGRYEIALSHHQASLGILLPIFENKPEAQLTLELIDTFINIGETEYVIGNIGEAIISYSKCIDFARQLIQLKKTPLTFKKIVDALNGLANLKNIIGAHETAEILLIECFSLQREWVDLFGETYESISSFSRMSKTYGHVKDALGFPSIAASAFKDVLLSTEKLMLISKYGTEDIHNLGIAMGLVGYSEYKKKNYDKALHYCNEALRIFKQVRLVEGENHGILKQLTGCLNDMGDIMATKKEFCTALQFYNESLLIARQLYAALSTSPDFVCGLGSVLNNIGKCEMARKDFKSAFSCHKESLFLAYKNKRIVGDAPHVLRELAVSHSFLADAKIAMGKFNSALLSSRASLLYFRKWHILVGNKSGVLYDIGCQIGQMTKIKWNLNHRGAVKIFVFELGKTYWQMMKIATAKLSKRKSGAFFVK